MPVHVSWGRHVVNVRCDWFVCLSSKVWETRGIFLGIHEFLWFFSFFLQNNLVPTNYDIGAYLAGDQVIHSGQVMQYGSMGSFVICHALYSKLSIITLQCRPMSIMTSQITGKPVYLFNSFFRLAATKISKLRITVLCDGTVQIHRWPVDSRHKVPVMGKNRLHVMTSWWLLQNNSVTNYDTWLHSVGNEIIGITPIPYRLLETQDIIIVAVTDLFILKGG